MRTFIISIFLLLITVADDVSADYHFKLKLVSMSREARSSSDYEIWLGPDLIRLDRSASVHGVESGGRGFEWDRLILRGDDDRRMEINVGKRSYVERSLSSYDQIVLNGPSRDETESEDEDALPEHEFSIIEIGAKETISGVKTKRLLLTTHGRAANNSPGQPSFIYIADLWIADKKRDGLELRSILPSIDRELAQVWQLTNPDPDAINHMSAVRALLKEIMDRDWRPLRSTLGIVLQGYDDEKLAKRVEEISAYADLPMMTLVHFEVYDLETIEIPENRFNIPIGFRNVNP